MPNHKLGVVRELVDAGVSSRPRTTAEAARLIEPGAIVLDLRPPLAFARGFIPGSYSASDEQCLRLACALLHRSFAALHTLGGTEAQMAQASALFASLGTSITHLGEIAIDRVLGNSESGTIEVIEAQQLAVRILGWKTTVLDLRAADDYQADHTGDALNVSLEMLGSSVFGLPLTTPVTMVSDSTGMSAFGASILFRQGFRNLAILRDGFTYYKDCGLPLAPK